MDFTGFLYLLRDVAGPILLLAVIAWAIWRNRKSRIPEQVTERGARQVYREEEQRRRSGTDDEER
jgi:hypothetical protein